MPVFISAVFERVITEKNKACLTFRPFLRILLKMGSMWKKAKIALGLNLCLYVPKTHEESSSSSPENLTGRFSDAVSLSPASHDSNHRPKTPTTSSTGLLLSKSGSKSSKRTCAICLTTLRTGNGHAIFTAECSHSFHFHCIASNVKHGNRICPICRAKWNEVPFQRTSDLSGGKSRINRVSWALDDSYMAILRRSQLSSDAGRPTPLLQHAPEPSRYDDDEILDNRPEPVKESISNAIAAGNISNRNLNILTHSEVPEVPCTVSMDDFMVLIHLKAPQASDVQDNSRTQSESSPVSRKSRAPIDLVTVLDVSGSMAGTKLALLKRAMGFLIQNLGPCDRLSVIAFSSTARRLFPLRRMTELGRQQALQAVNSLISNGGTNIAEGLTKAAKIMAERRWKNTVGSIILLSDGQDTYNISNASASGHHQMNYQFLLPTSMQRNNVSSLQIPVHTFGFGTDHDAASMHSISEISGGTFSFIEAESTIQDAFAQCIGGLLSVVVQDLKVDFECVDPGVQLNSIKSGSYCSCLASDRMGGSIDVGDLYAEEERDFLVTIKIPYVESTREMSLLKVRCAYRDPVSKEMVRLEGASDVKIQRRLERAREVVVSMEVDRQRNRLQAAEAMKEARAAAEHGDLSKAVCVLETCRTRLSETVSAQAGDRLCIALSAELKEMQDRMANRQVYEASGRAYVLSGLSSHSWQRATARGDSTSTGSLVQAYQTPTMVDMVTQSQTMIFGSPMPRRKLRQVLSLPARPHPR